MKTQTLHPGAAALSVALLSALVFFVWTLFAYKTAYGEECLMFFIDLYPYYEISVRGAFWGALWAFLDAWLGVYICVSLYNFIVLKTESSKKK